METADNPFDPYTYQGSSEVQLTYGYAASTSSFLFFVGLNRIVNKRTPGKIKQQDVPLWNNTLISWVHAVIASGCAVYCLVFKPEIFGDLVRYCDYTIYTLLSVSIGYFIYDLLDAFISDDTLKKWDIILHHIVILTCYIYHLHYRILVPYTVISLLLEVNTVFLHSRKLMQLCRLPSNQWPYRIVVWLNFTTFIMFRMCSTIALSVEVYNVWYELTIFYKTIFLLGAVVMNILNPVLLWRLFKSDILRHYRKSAKSNGHTPGQRNDVNKTLHQE